MSFILHDSLFNYKVAYNGFGYVLCNEIESRLTDSLAIQLVGQLPFHAVFLILVRVMCASRQCTEKAPMLNWVQISTT